MLVAFQPAPAPPQICKICGVSTENSKCRTACNACKQFYSRTWDKLYSLTCITGRNDCLSSASQVDNKNVRRNYCARCRIAKCVEAGLKAPGSAQTTKVAMKQQAPVQVVAKRVPQQFVIEQVLQPYAIIAKAPQRYECTFGESTLKLVLDAVVELSVLQSINWGNVELPNAAYAWQNAMVGFEQILNAGVSYVKILNTLTTLPTADRCSLFSKSLPEFLVLQVALPNMPIERRFFGMSPKVARNFLKYFPEYQCIADDIMEIASVMEAWQPTLIELGILQAMVFFRTRHNSNLLCPQMVEEMNQCLQSVLDWHLARSAGNPTLRKHFFMRVYEYLVMKFTGDYYDTIASLAARLPDVIQFNGIFADIHLRLRPEARAGSPQARICSPEHYVNYNSPLQFSLESSSDN